MPDDKYYECEECDDTLCVKCDPPKECPSCGSKFCEDCLAEHECDEDDSDE